MAITEDDIRQLIAANDQGRANWINGEGPHLDGVGWAEDVTPFSPFGGPDAAARFSSEELASGQRSFSARGFQGGDGYTEVVQTIVEGHVAILVLIERSNVMFEGQDAPHPWILRVTLVFRRIGDEWVVLHRHADPLIRSRSLDQTIGLLEEV